MTDIQSALETGLAGRYALERELGRLEKESASQYIRAESMALGYAAVGEADRPFTCLERALQERSAGLIFFQADPQALLPGRGPALPGVGTTNRVTDAMTFALIMTCTERRATPSERKDPPA